MGEARRRKLLDPLYGKTRRAPKGISWAITPADSQPDLTNDRTLAWFTLQMGAYSWKGHVFESDETPDGIGFLSQAHGVDQVSRYLSAFKAARPGMATEVFSMLARHSK